MQDVYDERLRYRHNGLDVPEDHFSFTVTDPGSGYLGTPEIGFIIDENTTILATDDLPADVKLDIFPNPADDLLNIAVIGEGFEVENINIYSIHGMQMMQLAEMNTRNRTIDISGLLPGMYLVQVNSGKYSVVKKIAVY